jgi:aquaporin related protein
MYLFFAFLLHSAAVSQQPPDQPPKPLTILTICAGYAFFYAFWLIINGIMLPTPLGGYFNPAITLGRVVAGALHSLALAVLIPAQIMGAVSAAAVVKAVVNPGEEGLVKIQVFLAPGINVTQGLVIEMVSFSEGFFDEIDC